MSRQRSETAVGLGSAPDGRGLSLAGAIWGRTRPFRPVLALLSGLVIVLSPLDSGFLTVVNLQNIATSVCVLWIIAMGATFVQLSGGIDLSSGAVAALAGICLAKLAGTGLPGPVVIMAVVAFGAVVGALVNGIPVGILRLNVFVVTLASMTAITGAVSLWSGTQSIYVTSPAVAWLALDTFLGTPMPVWIMAAAFLVFLYVQTRTYFGRDVYAVGGGMTAARLSGIRTSRTLVAVWAVAGAMGAVAGVIAVGRIGAAAPVPDDTLPLNAIAAILLGGSSLTGGVGGVGGTALGVLFIGVLQNGLSLSGIPTYWQQIVTGIILVVAVLADRMQGWRLRPSARPGSPPGRENAAAASPGHPAAAGSGDLAPARAANNTRQGP